MLSRTSFTDAIVAARPGQKLIYHTGSLMYDRLRGPMFQAIHGAATAAWDAYEAGVVTLTQRRLAHLVFEYTATKK